MSFRVDLDVFQGPLDLLVYLVRKHEVDPTEVAVGPIAEQYLELVETLGQIDVDAAAEFLELAADRRLVDPQRLRKEYLANFERYRTELREACSRTMVDYHLLRTDEPVERALGVYLSRRQRQR